MKKPPWLLAPPGAIEEGAVVALDAGEGRHATGPLRLRAGDAVVIADGHGTVAEAVLAIEGRSQVAAVVEGVRRVPSETTGGLTLALAVLDGKAMDWAIQKAVEIGVRDFQPLITDRTQGGRREQRGFSSHMQKIALQALKQCRRPWAMEIMEARTLEQVLERRGRAGGVVADPGGHVIAELPPTAEGYLAVGPEGGFSPAEEELLSDRNWHRLRLGDNTLRAETAAIVGCALMMARGRGHLG